MKKIFLLLITIVYFSFSNFNEINQTEQTFILGIWQSTDDSNVKIEFKSDGTHYTYYSNELTGSYTYTIITTSPICEQTVPTGSQFSYLKLINVNDSNDVYCYEIVSLDESDFDIRFFDRPGIQSYKKM